MSKEIVQIKELPIYIGGLEAKLKEMQYAERSNLGLMTAI